MLRAIGAPDPGVVWVFNSRLRVREVLVYEQWLSYNPADFLLY